MEVLMTSRNFDTAGVGQALGDAWGAFGVSVTVVDVESGDVWSNDPEYAAEEDTYLDSLRGHYDDTGRSA
jgi:hypothetical protein